MRAFTRCSEYTARGRVHAPTQVLDALARGACPLLRALGLGHDELGDASCVALAAMAAHPARARLEALDLSQNALSGSGVAALAGALARGGLPRLKSLQLYHTHLDTVGVEAVAESGKRGLRALESLSLHGNSFATAGVDALADALRGGAFPQLKRLVLPGQHWQHGGVKAACEAREALCVDMRG